MAVPKRRVSKQRKHKRRGEHKAEVVNHAACPKCGDPKLPHRVCRNCGYYNGEQVLKIEEEI
jgi:large subunit ribosomal protein L32